MSDYSVFATPDFNPNEYANAILAGEPYPDQKYTKLSIQDPIAKEDISVAISKLTSGIDDVAKQIKQLVTAHHEQFLLQAASANALSGSLSSVRSNLSDLNASVEKLRLKVHVPCDSLQTLVSRLKKLQQACDVLRRTSRFIILSRRLQVQMNEMRGIGPDTSTTSISDDAIPLTSEGLSHDSENEKERVVAKAALSIAELATLLDGLAHHSKQASIDGGQIDISDPSSLRSITVVAARVTFIEEARSKVTNEMENMVVMGLSTLNQTLLASSLQIAFNLRVLPSLVQNLVSDLSHTVDDRIRGAFDLSKISKDVVSKDSGSNPPSPQIYRSRVRTEPTNVTAPQWTAALWLRLEAMFQAMADCCIKVNALEKVLKLKKDITTHVIFLDEAMKLLENTPSAIFWTSLSRSLEKHLRDSAKASSFLQQTLSSGYPKLLRLFHDFFGKIAVQTDTIYIDAYQSPEAILVLRALSNIESMYLSRSTNRMNEAAGQAFAGGNRMPPGSSEGINLARTIVNELDSAKFDPLLVKAVAKNTVSCLELTLSRVDGVTVRDRSAVSLSGPSATPQQVSNAHLATFLEQTWSRLVKLGNEHLPLTFNLLQPSIQKLRQAYENLIDPMKTAIRRELSAVIAKLHRIDFAKSVDPMSGGSSPYMKELTEKLAFIKAEIISRYDIDDSGWSWTVSIVKYTIKIFLLHISIANPLGESGKLQMTSDMTELEFALSAFLTGGTQNKRGGSLEGIGDEYRALRAMRPLLFLENSQLSSAQHTAGLPVLIVLHHILVRSPMPLPHELHGWQAAEYVRWLDEHTEEEALTLIDGGLTHWEKVSEEDEGVEYLKLARSVMKLHKLE